MSFLEKRQKHGMIFGISLFVPVALAVILVATLGMQEFVVPVCVLVIIETLMAVLLKKSEIWIHGVVVMIQLATGFLIQRLPLTALCTVIYVAATVALMLINKEQQGVSEEIKQDEMKQE